MANQVTAPLLRSICHSCQNQRQLPHTRNKECLLACLKITAVVHVRKDFELDTFSTILKNSYHWQNVTRIFFAIIITLWARTWNNPELLPRPISPKTLVTINTTCNLNTKALTLYCFTVMLFRFEKLGIPSLKPYVEERYAYLLQHFGREVEVISKVSLIEIMSF